jgi:hypothetical protein
VLLTDFPSLFVDLLFIYLFISFFLFFFFFLSRFFIHPFLLSFFISFLCSVFSVLGYGSVVFQVATQTGAQTIGLETDARVHALSVKLRERLITTLPEGAGGKGISIRKK